MQKAQLSFFAQLPYGVHLSRSGGLLDLDYLRFSSVDVSGLSSGTINTGLGSVSTFFSLSLASLCQSRVTSDFALSFGAVDVGVLCSHYLGIHTQHVQGVGVLNVHLT